MEWDHQQEQQEEQPKEDDVVSVSSSESSSTSTSGTMHSSISSISNTKTTSAAVDALVIASLLPSTHAAAAPKTRSTDEFDDMPSIHLIGRQFDIDTAVLTEAIAEMVRILPCLSIFLKAVSTNIHKYRCVPIFPEDTELHKNGTCCIVWINMV